MYVAMLQNWVALGSMDLDEFVDNNLTDLADYEKNMRLVKLRGRDCEKLPQ